MMKNNYLNEVRKIWFKHVMLLGYIIRVYISSSKDHEAGNFFEERK